MVWWQMYEKENCYSQPILNHVRMNWQPTLAVNDIDLITSKWQVSGLSKFYDLQIMSCMYWAIASSPCLSNVR
jgi:hypothetical protein